MARTNDIINRAQQYKSLGDARAARDAIQRPQPVNVIAAPTITPVQSDAGRVVEGGAVDYATPTIVGGEPIYEQSSTPSMVTDPNSQNRQLITPIAPAAQAEQEPTITYTYYAYDDQGREQRITESQYEQLNKWAAENKSKNKTYNVVPAEVINDSSGNWWINSDGMYEYIPSTTQAKARLAEINGIRAGNGLSQHSTLIIGASPSKEYSDRWYSTGGGNIGKGEDRVRVITSTPAKPVSTAGRGDTPTSGSIKLAELNNSSGVNNSSSAKTNTAQTNKATVVPKVEIVPTASQQSTKENPIISTANLSPFVKPDLMYSTPEEKAAITGASQPFETVAQRQLAENKKYVAADAVLTAINPALGSIGSKQIIEKGTEALNKANAAVNPFTRAVLPEIGGERTYDVFATGIVDKLNAEKQPGEYGYYGASDLFGAIAERTKEGTEAERVFTGLTGASKKVEALNKEAAPAVDDFIAKEYSDIRDKPVSKAIEYGAIYAGGEIIGAGVKVAKVASAGGGELLVRPVVGLAKGAIRSEAVERVVGKELAESAAKSLIEKPGNALIKGLDNGQIVDLGMMGLLGKEMGQSAAEGYVHGGVYGATTNLLEIGKGLAIGAGGFKKGQEHAESVLRIAGESTGVIRSKTFGSKGGETSVPYKSTAEAVEAVFENPRISGVRAVPEPSGKVVRVRDPGELNDVSAGSKGKFMTISSEDIEPYGAFFTTKEGNLVATSRVYLQENIRTVQVPEQLKADIYKSIAEKGEFRQQYKEVMRLAKAQSAEYGEPIAVPSPKRSSGYAEPENEVFLVMTGKGSNVITGKRFVGITEGGSIIHRVSYGNQPAPAKAGILDIMAENLAYNADVGVSGTKVYKKGHLDAMVHDMQRRTAELNGEKLSYPGAYDAVQHGPIHARNVEQNMINLGVSRRDAHIRAELHDVAKIGAKETTPIEHGRAAEIAIRTGKFTTPELEAMSDAERLHVAIDIGQHTEIKPFNIHNLKQGIKTAVFERPSVEAKALATADRMDLTRYGMEVDQSKLFFKTGETVDSAFMRKSLRFDTTAELIPEGKQIGSAGKLIESKSEIIGGDRYKTPEFAEREYKSTSYREYEPKPAGGYFPAVVGSSYLPGFDTKDRIGIQGSKYNEYAKSDRYSPVIGGNTEYAKQYPDRQTAKGYYPVFGDGKYKSPYSQEYKQPSIVPGGSYVPPYKPPEVPGGYIPPYSPHDGEPTLPSIYTQHGERKKNGGLFTSRPDDDSNNIADSGIIGYKHRTKKHYVKDPMKFVMGNMGKGGGMF